MPVPRTLPIYVCAGSVFGAMSARLFLLPLRLHELGASRTDIGLVAAVTTLTGALLSVPAGYLADRYGTRRLLLVSLLAGLASQVGVATTSSVFPMYLWQALMGVTAGAVQAALFAALGAIVPRQRLGQALGWMTLAMQLGFLIGPALAGFALEVLDLRQALFAAIGLFLVALAAGSATAGTPGQRQSSWDFITPMRKIARERGFWAMTAGLLGATVVWGTLQAYLPVFGTEQLRLRGSQVGYMLAIQAMFNGLSRVPAGRIVDASARRGPIVLVGVTVFSLALFLLPHLSGFWPPTALLALSVPFLATAYVALGVAFTGLSEESRGVAMGLYSAVLFFGLGLGPAALGPVMQADGYAAGFTACAGLGIAFVAVMAVLRTEPVRRRLERAPAFPPPAPGT